MIDRSDRRTLAVMLAALLAIVAIGVMVANDLTDPFDAMIIGLVRDDAAPFSFLRPLTEAGSTWAVTAVAVVVLVVLSFGGWPRHAALAAGLIGLTALANTLLKRGVARARPDALEPLVVEHGFSFPSGHALLSATAFGIVAVLVLRSRLPGGARQLVAALLALLVLLVGVSRIYLGVHYPSDVLAGWIAGLAVVVLFARLTRTAGAASAAADGRREAG
jgi:undecaprenyl-diphosphatase